MGESDSKRDEEPREQDEDSVEDAPLEADAPVDDADEADEADAPERDDERTVEKTVELPRREATEREEAPSGTSRRQFLDTAIMGGTAVVGVASAYPALRFLEPVEGATASAATVASVGDFPPGTSKSARLGATPVLVIRDPAGAFRAYEAVCPHLQCVVRFAREDGDIACACHGGRFALNGSPKSGPPKQPLKVLRVNVIGEDVVVSRA